MRIAIAATVLLWALIFGLILLCFPDFSFAERRAVIKIRTYYKPGYQSVSPEWAQAIHRIALRRTERLLPVRFSHSFREIPSTVAQYEQNYTGCYRIPGFEGGACCPMEYLERHREQVGANQRAQRLNEVPMFINPPVGGNFYYNGDWLSGGIAIVGCYGGGKFNTSIGIINATEVNRAGEPRRRAMTEVYRHELFHTAFNAYHIESDLNVMSTFSPLYNHVEALLGDPFWDFLGLYTHEETLKSARSCIKANRKKKK